MQTLTEDGLEMYISVVGTSRVLYYVFNKTDDDMRETSLGKRSQFVRE